MGRAANGLARGPRLRCGRVCAQRLGGRRARCGCGRRRAAPSRRLPAGTAVRRRGVTALRLGTRSVATGFGRALWWHPWLVTVALCGIVLASDMRGPDLPAADLRAW